MTDTTILCVDPDESEREATMESLRSHGEDPDLVPASSLAAAEEALHDRDVDCVVSEYDLPDGTGLELAGRVREVRPSVGCILYTDADRDELDTTEFGEAVAEYVPKDAPSADEQLWTVVEVTATFRVQTAYPLPQDESERLAALDAYNLDPELLRDDIEKVTDLAAHHLDVPLSSVNIITEHTQEFLACHGADWSPTSREDSICTYAIADEGQVMVVEDVRDDPRFERNDELEDLGIRSYAGADLTTADGLAIGTLCVYDDVPRTFSADDREYLRTLADLAMTVIELRHEVTELREDESETEIGGERA